MKELTIGEKNPIKEKVSLDRQQQLDKKENEFLEFLQEVTALPEEEIDKREQVWNIFSQKTS